MSQKIHDHRAQEAVQMYPKKIRVHEELLYLGAEAGKIKYEALKEFG